MYAPGVAVGKTMRSAPKRAAPRLVLRLTPIASAVVEKIRLTTTATATVMVALRIGDALRFRRTSREIRVETIDPRQW